MVYHSYHILVPSSYAIVVGLYNYSTLTPTTLHSHGEGILKKRIVSVNTIKLKTMCYLEGNIQPLNIISSEAAIILDISYTNTQF